MCARNQNTKANRKGLTQLSIPPSPVPRSPARLRMPVCGYREKLRPLLQIARLMYLTVGYLFDGPCHGLHVFPRASRLVRRLKQVYGLAEVQDLRMRVTDLCVELRQVWPGCRVGWRWFDGFLLFPSARVWAVLSGAACTRRKI